MHCIDSDFAIAILKGDKDAKKTLDTLEKQGMLAMTSLSVFEVMYVTKGLSKARKIASMNLIDTLTILDLDKHSALLAGNIGRKLAKGGEMLHPMDLLIGAIARAHDLPFVTRNVDHFSRIKGLKVKVW